MSPEQVERDRATLHRIVGAERWRVWVAIGFLVALGSPMLVAAALGRAGHGSDRVAAIVLGILATGLAAGFAARQLRLREIARRLTELAARPDLIVWIYEQELRYGSRTISNIYVCSRRGERLRVLAPGPHRDEAIELLGRLAPDAPRGFSRARDAAFQRDPLSVASA